MVKIVKRYAGTHIAESLDWEPESDPELDETDPEVGGVGDTGGAELPEPELSEPESDTGIDTPEDPGPVGAPPESEELS